MYRLVGPCTPDFFQATDEARSHLLFYLSLAAPHLCLFPRRCPADWRLPPGVRSSYGPVAAAVGALGGPAAGARASGCAHSRLPPHAALPFVGSFLRRCARPLCLRATAGAAAGLGQLTSLRARSCRYVKWFGPPVRSSLGLKSPPQWYALPSSPLVLVCPRPPLRVRPARVRPARWPKRRSQLARGHIRPR